MTNVLTAARDALEQIREWEPCISYTDGHEDFDDNQPISANRFDFSLGHMLRNTNVIKIKSNIEKDLPCQKRSCPT